MGLILRCGPFTFPNVGRGSITTVLLVPGSQGLHAGHRRLGTGGGRLLRSGWGVGGCDTWGFSFEGWTVIPGSLGRGERGRALTWTHSL